MFKSLNYDILFAVVVLSFDNDCLVVYFLDLKMVPSRVVYRGRFDGLLCLDFLYRLLGGLRSLLSSEGELLLGHRLVFDRLEERVEL